MTRFVDRVVLHVAAGNGGHGVASIHREKFKPLGGPDGGNGGRGGDVVLTVDRNVHTLLDFHHHPHQKAGNGKQGAGSNRNGAEGADLDLRVPDGTVVLDRDGEVLADLTGLGATFVAAQGGRGGLGNAALASTRRKAPGFALLGEPGKHAVGSSLFLQITPAGARSWSFRFSWGGKMREIGLGRYPLVALFMARRPGAVARAPEHRSHRRARVSACGSAGGSRGSSPR